MPDISSTGTYDKDTAGFEFLAGGEPKTKTLMFSGSTLPTTLTINAVDDTGTSSPLQNGAITVLPTTVEIGANNRDLEIIVTGGSPDFNVTYGGSTKNW